jgi:hypothetical protein
MINQRYVCSLEISRKLRRAGITQTSLFSSDDANNSIGETYAAFTSAEIKDHFPNEIWVTVGEKSLRRKEAAFHFAKHKGIHKVSLMVVNSSPKEVYELQREEGANEADACALMLLYLKKNSLLEPNV